MLRNSIRNSIRSFKSADGGGFVGLLDTYGGAAAAYSFRRLSSTYSGNLIEVRRSSDNTIQDIGYDANGDLDTTALLAFVGAGDGFVRTWYDQSGNGNNAQQTTTTLQPRIVSSGTLETENGKTCIEFLTTRYFIIDNLASTFSGQANQINLSWFTSLSAGANSSKFFLSFSDNTNIAYLELLRTNGIAPIRSSVRADDLITTIDVISTANIQAQSLVSIIGLASDFDVYKNGAFVINGANASIDSLNITQTKGRIGNIARSIGGLIWGGNSQEVIMYNSNQSANRTGIENNINDYYSIY